MDEEEWQDFDWDENWEEDFEEERLSYKKTSSSWRWCSLLSIISGFGWLIFLVIWLFFYASDYEVYQNLAVILLSIFLVLIINGASWKSFDRRHKLRSITSIIFGLIWLGFIIYWLFYHASDFSFMENIAVFILSLLVLGGLNSVLWIPGRSGISWRAAISAVSGIGWVIFLIIWFLMFRTDYTIYQNLAIFIVSILVLAAINVLIWVPYGLRKARKYM
ncbi:MAG: hypothetical protein ACOCZJ_00485 [Thermoplasmatota archaeon]